jgi:predicted membrane-bound dolichyl-phosphate-mannose-protein mannosyltransferase
VDWQVKTSYTPYEISLDDVLVCLGNAFVLLVILFKRKYRNNVTHCYIMNLAVTDFLFLIMSVPLTNYLGIEETWIFGTFLCKMHIYLAHVSLFSSVDRLLF